MSINVNVHGNPVSIRRGKLVATDPNYLDKEFKKRRIIRLEQVRQQSREIAQHLRNKVRKVKDGELPDLDKKREKELKKWQVQKLLALEKEYCDCLKEVGLSGDRSDDQDDVRNRVALERTKRAVKKHLEPVSSVKKSRERHGDDESRPEPRQPSPTPVSSHDLEDDGSDFVQSINLASPVRKKLYRSPERNENLSIHACRRDISCQVDCDLASSPEESPTSGSESPSPKKKSKRKARSKSPKKKKKASKSKSPKTKKSPVKQAATTQTDHLNQASKCVGSSGLDKRISERIKCRSYTPYSPTHQRDVNPEKNCNLYEACKVDDHKLAQPIREVTKKFDAESRIVPRLFLGDEDEDISEKPAVNLKSSPKRSEPVSKKFQSKVNYYDHANRFGKKYVTDNSMVRKIPTESLEVIPSEMLDVEYSQPVYKNEQDAASRGKKAMEKEKAKKTYNQLMKKLPVLEKQERIETLSMDKAKYHMSENRLKEQEVKKQKQLDRAYENLFPKVTVPTKAVQASKPSGKVQPKATVIDVGSWDVSAIKSDRKQEKVDSTSPTSKDRSDVLLQILTELTQQRDKLIKLLSNAPEGKSKKILIEDIEKVDGFIKNAQTKRNEGKIKKVESPKKKKVEKETSSEEQSAEIKSKKVESPKSKKLSSPSKPARKPPIKKKLEPMLTSTDETSSKIQSTESSESKPVTVTDPVISPKKKSEPCSCCLKDSICLEELCEIRIRLSEGAAPRICVSPKKLQSKEVLLETRDEKPISKDVPQSSKEKTVSSSKESCTGKKVATSTKEMGKKVTSTKPMSSVEKKRISNKEVAQSSAGKKVVSTKKKRTSPKKIETKSWREHLNFSAISSSTSYYSPPDLRKIPKELVQSEDLLYYIKELLAMSPESVDNLAVSSVSDVSTPSSKTINTSSNNPQYRLQTILDFIKKHPESLSTSSDYSTLNKTPDCDKFREYTSNNFPKVLTAYNKLTENCAKKIENFTSMIEQVRMEKLSMMQSGSSSSAGSDKENSTRYMDLPVRRVSPISPDQIELNKKLTEINYDLFGQFGSDVKDKEIESDVDDSDKELRRQFRRLIDDSLEESTETIVGRMEIFEQGDFVPILSNIPKLPKLEHPPPVDEKKWKPRPPPSKGIAIVKRFNNEVNIQPHELSTIVEGDSQLSIYGSPKKTPKQEQNAVISIESSSSEIAKESSRSTESILSQPSETEASFNDNIEQLLKQMGMSWAASTLKKTQNAMALSSSTTSTDSRKDSSSTNTSEVSLKDFLARQFLSRVSPLDRSDTADTSSRFMQDLSALQASSGSNKRTSTPVQKEKRSD